MDAVLDAVQKSMKANTGKATVADFIRLLQLQQDLKAEEVKEIVVTWVDPSSEE